MPLLSTDILGFETNHSLGLGHLRFGCQLIWNWWQASSWSFWPPSNLPAPRLLASLYAGGQGIEPISLQLLTCWHFFQSSLSYPLSSLQLLHEPSKHASTLNPLSMLLDFTLQSCCKIKSHIVATSSRLLPLSCTFLPNFELVVSSLVHHIFDGQEGCCSSRQLDLIEGVICGFLCL